METELLQREPRLAEIVHRLIEACRPERIYLFGSKARGEAGSDSDYDIREVYETILGRLPEEVRP